MKSNHTSSSHGSWSPQPAQNNVHENYDNLFGLSLLYRATEETPSQDQENTKNAKLQVCKIQKEQYENFVAAIETAIQTGDIRTLQQTLDILTANADLCAFVLETLQKKQEIKKTNKQSTTAPDCG